MELTLKQRKFCEHYASNGNATESAKLAGYSEKTANEQGSRLLANVSIQEYLKSLTQVDSDKRIMDAVERQQLLTTIARNDEAQAKDRLKAVDQLSKIQGDYIERHQVETSTDITIKIIHE